MTIFDSQIFAIASIVYLRSIVKSMAEVRNHQSSMNTGKLATLNSAVRGLIFSSVVSAVVAFAHFSACCTSLHVRKQLIRCRLLDDASRRRALCSIRRSGGHVCPPLQLEVTLTDASWAYTIFGGLGTIVILFRSFSPGPSSPSTTTSRIDTKVSLSRYHKSRLGFTGIHSGDAGEKGDSIELSRSTMQSVSYQVELGRNASEVEGMSKELAPFHETV